MGYIYFLLLFFFLYNINFVSSTIYRCDRNATCGCSKNDAELNKIVGGESAVLSSWGWAVSLQRKSTGSHFCGGSIISPLYIITAAHCVEDPREILLNTNVVVGINILSQTTSSLAQVRSVVSVFSHPQYNSDSFMNDIAVLRLNQTLDISNEKGTARLCLPHIVPTNMSNRYPVSDTPLVAIGWGLLRSTETSIPSSRSLQQVTLNAISASHLMCRTTINYEQLQFCAGVIGGGKDTCQGDSGGPLMQFDSVERRWVLAGVTSYGRGCALPDFAGVYTRASVYNDWLRSIVNDGFVQLTINGTTSTSSSWFDSAGSILSPYWSLVLLLLYLTA